MTQGQLRTQYRKLYSSSSQALIVDVSVDVSVDVFVDVFPY